MYSIFIAISLYVLSAILFFIAAKFWFPRWREKKSGTAHALFLTNAFLIWVVIFRIIQTILWLRNEVTCSYHPSLVAAVFMVLVSVYQFALVRGYFNFKEM